MKKILFAVLFLVFAELFTFSVCIAEEKHKIDIDEEKCLSTAYSTADMRNCTYKAMDAWFVEIDRYSNLLRKKLSKEKLEIFENTQKKWKEYQLAEFDFINLTIHSKGGSIYTVIGNDYKREIVKNRAMALNRYYKEIAE